MNSTLLLTDRVIIDGIANYFAAYIPVYKTDQIWPKGVWIETAEWTVSGGTFLGSLGDGDDMQLPTQEIRLTLAHKALDSWHQKMALKSLESDVANNLPNAAIQLANFKEQHGIK